MGQLASASLLLAVGAASTAVAAGEWRSAYTEISEADCKPIPPSGEENDEGGLRCSGPAGYQLLALSGDLRSTVTLVSPDGKEHALEFWEAITSAFSSLGPRAEWLLDAEGQPHALIVRVLASEDPEHPDRKTSYLAVAKIGAEATCVTDNITASADDNARARLAAESSASRPCLAQARE
jgi:hypothetical protein